MRMYVFVCSTIPHIAIIPDTQVEMVVYKHKELGSLKHAGCPRVTEQEFTLCS